MSISFAAEFTSETENVVETVFANPVLVQDESTAEAKPVPAQRVGLIRNYRGYVTAKQGRKARGAGENVLILSAFQRIPARELPALIEKLEELNASLTQV